MVNLLKAVLAANLCFVQLAVAHPKESKSDTTPAFQLPDYPSDQGYELLYVDPETHSLVHKKVDGVSKRGKYEDPVVSIIRKNKPEKFCRSYCPIQCASSKPQVKTIKTTTTVCTTTTATVCPYGCKTTVLSTVTAPRPVATVTRASTTVLTRLSTVRAPTSTILTTVTDTSTVTEVTTTTTTSVIPIGFKGDTPAPRGLDERDARVPSYLRRYSRQQICNACAVVYPPPRSPTQTVKKLVTATKTVTKTTTKRPSATITKVSTFTPSPTTRTRTTPTTVTTTRFTTTTPSTTRTITDFTTTTTTEEATATATICEGQQQVIGMSITPPGRFEELGNFKDSAGCCVACFRYQGCQSWAFLRSRDVNWCTIVVEFNFGDGTATAECPAGSGGGQFLLVPSGSDSFGGPGQCSV
ncbi:hypothetical protein HYQ45_013230 [Verticillium longisporum]|uniref:Apple domain-containing protein n=1 Tax=Verticillium longisporum TaxID=100787 RepID=A0A8I3AL59_VERLO|nr:hypothetical protein HYQ45_013230 [Verticillium longisporum]